MTNKTVTFKNIVFELPPDNLFPDHQYVFMTRQLEKHHPLPYETHQAVIRFICDLLNY